MTGREQMRVKDEMREDVRKRDDAGDAPVRVGDDQTVHFGFDDRVDHSGKTVSIDAIANALEPLKRNRRTRRSAVRSVLRTA